MSLNKRIYNKLKAGSETVKKSEYLKEQRERGKQQKQDTRQLQARIQQTERTMEGKTRQRAMRKLRGREEYLDTSSLFKEQKQPETEEEKRLATQERIDRTTALEKSYEQDLAEQRARKASIKKLKGDITKARKTGKIQKMKSYKEIQQGS